MLLAFAGGLVHLSIYVDHTPLRIEYGLFLLLAAIAQIGFGVLLLSTLLFNSNVSRNFRCSHRRNFTIYLFGMIGSVILLGLYTYSVNLPPPLYPENHPEEIELAGIVAKSLEISLVGVIVYVMILENRQKMEKDLNDQ